MRAPGSHAMHAMFICGFVCVRACTTGPNVIGWDLGFGAFAPAQHLTAFAARGKLIVWTLKINLSRTLKVFDVGAVLWGGSMACGLPGTNGSRNRPFNRQFTNGARGHI